MSLINLVLKTILIKSNLLGVQLGLKGKGHFKTCVLAPSTQETGAVASRAAGRLLGPGSETDGRRLFVLRIKIPLGIT